MNVFWISLIATVVVGVGTYLTRASFILALADRDIPIRIRTALSFVAPAVMAALVVSLTLGSESEAGRFSELAALGVGGAVGWRTGSLVWVLVSGMASLWILSWLL